MVGKSRKTRPICFYRNNLDPRANASKWIHAANEHKPSMLSHVEACGSFWIPAFAGMTGPLLAIGRVRPGKPASPDTHPPHLL